MSLTRIPPEIVRAAQDGEFEDGESCLICLAIFDECYRLPLCHNQVHVWCINCAIARFTKAAEGDPSLIPLQCDGPEHALPIDALRHLLPKSTIDLYKSKLEEKTAAHRAYCCKPECAMFLPARHHVSTDWYSMARCRSCDTTTCVGCGEEWKDSHVCDPLKVERSLPPYTSALRIKQCPRCSRVIELSEACNHMTCACGHEFCFICLLGWDGGHDCPTYGDPTYDEQGRDWRDLNARTGLDSDGFNRIGHHADGRQRDPRVLREPEHHTHGGFEGEDDGDLDVLDDDHDVDGGNFDQEDWPIMEQEDWPDEAIMDHDDGQDDLVIEGDGWATDPDEAAAEDDGDPQILPTDEDDGPWRATIDAAWHEQVDNMAGIAVQGAWNDTIEEVADR